MSRAEAPVGVVLAGGRGRRLGGAKATAPLAGRALVEHPLAALRAVLREVVVVAKADTELPAWAPGAGEGPAVWIESAASHHPLVGIVTALGRAGGRPIVVCACDLPLVGPAEIRALAGATGTTIVGTAAGTQPLLGRYASQALEPLAELLAADPAIPLRAAVARLAPRLIAPEDPRRLLNVNTAEDLERAAALLAAYPKVKS